MKALRPYFHAARRVRGQHTFGPLACGPVEKSCVFVSQTCVRSPVGTTRGPFPGRDAFEFVRQSSRSGFGGPGKGTTSFRFRRTRDRRKPNRWRTSVRKSFYSPRRSSANRHRPITAISWSVVGDGRVRVVDDDRVLNSFDKPAGNNGRALAVGTRTESNNCARYGPLCGRTAETRNNY